jgi:hypothetical protein
MSSYGAAAGQATPGGYGMSLPSNPFQAYSPYGASGQAMGPQAASIGSGPQPISPATADKPFSNYSPRPVISPYMELYRTQTVDDFIGINRYYNYVRPRIEQEQRQRAVRRQFSQLEQVNRQQRQTIDQLQRETNAMQGTQQHQYFMNQSKYYQPPTSTQGYQAPRYQPRPYHRPTRTDNPFNRPYQ